MPLIAVASPHQSAEHSPNKSINIMRTIKKIITQVNTERGAPMGRSNVGVQPIRQEPDMSDLSILTDTHEFNQRWLMRSKELNKNMPRVYDTRVPMNGAYDTGGAYWGLGAELRVSYTKDLSFIKFYRVGEN